MNAPAPDFRRQKTAAIYALMGVSLIVGLLEGLLTQPAGTIEAAGTLQLVGSLAMLLAGFYWLHYDSRELAIRRPAWLNVGIVLLAIVFVPYYLYKTRPSGRRWPAIFGFLGIVLASLIVSALGAVFATLQGGGPVPGA